MPTETLSVQGRTGSRCPQSGPYRSSSKAAVVIFVRKGDTFPPGPDGQATTWTLVSE